MKIRPFKLLSFSAIGDEDELYLFRGPFGPRSFHRNAGEALHPEREPLSVLEGVRRDVGPRAFSAHYQQMPAPPAGNIINPDCFRPYTELPAEFDFVQQGWDIALGQSVSADFSVGITLGVKDGKAYLIDLFRKQIQYTTLKATIYAKAREFGADRIVIEDSPIAMALIQQLREENLRGLSTFKPTKSKVVRIEQHAARLEKGHLLVPVDAPWLSTFVHEIAAFPNGKHDDQVDALSLALGAIWPLIGPDAFMSYIRQDLAKRAEVKIPYIRLNHDDRGRRFSLMDGTTVRREADGSFLVDDEHFAIFRQLPGIRIIGKQPR